MRACWLKWVGRDWSISADYIWLNYSDANTVVPISTFVRESHGKFNQRAHELYAKRAMTSAHERSARNEFKFFDSILVSDLVSKKGQRLKASDLCFRWWAIQDSNL